MPQLCAAWKLWPATASTIPMVLVVPLGQVLQFTKNSEENRERLGLTANALEQAVTCGEYH